MPPEAAAQLVEPGGVHVQGDGATGQVSWVLRACWAEPLFVLWAMPVYPQQRPGGTRSLRSG